MRRTIFALVAALLIAAPSFAQTPARMVAQAPGGGFKNVQADSDGNLAWPPSGGTPTVVFSSTVAQNTSTSLTAFTAHSPGGWIIDPVVRIATSGFTALTSPWRVKFLGSFDGITYSYLMTDYFRGASSLASEMTSLEVTTSTRDTLMIRGKGNTVGTLVTGGIILPIAPRGSAQTRFPPFLAAVFSSDSSAAPSGTVTIEIGSEVR